MSERTWRRGESIEWFIEVQAFSLSSDLAPPPPPPMCKVDWPHRKTEKKRQNCWRERGRGKEGAKSYERDLYKYFNPVEQKECFLKL